MRAKSFFSLLMIAAGVLALANTANRCRIPGSDLTFLVDAEIKEEGDALKDLDADARELLNLAKEFSFTTRDGVSASIMRYEPKSELLPAVREWGKVIADGIEAVSDENTRFKSREEGRFGDVDGHLITLSLSSGTVQARADFVVISGKKEIVLIALTAAEDDEDALKTQKAILNSMEYADLKFTDRKPSKKAEITLGN